jgi:nucleoside-diphosphate-sugar epimerase
MKVLITGGGGFIGGHLAGRLIAEGFDVRCTDIKPKSAWWQVHEEAENRYSRDLRIKANCIEACQTVQRVFHLAARMGGIGFISARHAECALDNSEINLGMLRAALQEGKPRFLFASSACVYRQDAQDRPDVLPLKEEDAWPADPEAGYGLEKLYMEKLCQYAQEDCGLDVRVPRLHNVYGPMGDWRGGKEKAPAAICRKVAEAKLTGKHEIDIWGDGTFTRSFMYVDDCVEGMLRMMESTFSEPINLGTSEQVTINQLVSLVEQIAGMKLNRKHDLTKPQGVPGRNSDNTLIQLHFGWEPSTPLCSGLEQTYRWIEQQVQEKGACQ